MKAKNQSYVLMPFFVATLICFNPAPTQAAFDIPWFTIDGGGGQASTGGTHELSGTIGQPDAGAVMTGGTYALTGGFWSGAAAGSGPAPGDFDGDGDVDTADFASFAQCFGGAANPPAPNCPPGVDADLDDDGDVDTGDFAIFGQNYTGSL